MSCPPFFSFACEQDQFEQHVRPDVKLNVYLYYGSDRNRSKTFLSTQDVVITTYNVLSADFGVSVAVVTYRQICRCYGAADIGTLIYWYILHYIFCHTEVIVLFCSNKSIVFPFQNKSPLHAIDWLRVVLDEGHIIRNPNAQMSKAVLELKARRRWILSGISLPSLTCTPFVNHYIL